MRVLLFAIIFFGLPHSMWIPLRLNIPPEQIPLGVMNWLICAAVLLWFIGNSSGVRLKNSIKLYNVYVVITCLSIFLAFMYNFEDTMTTLAIFKNQTLLLLMYYLPLSCIKDEKEFKNIFYIMLAVNLLIGFEVMRSGVLAGVNFNDSKRGSGPFAQDYWGSDIAGAYLAQALMFLCALVLTTNIKLLHRAIGVLGSIVMILGVYATYARGALVGCVAGLTVMVAFLLRSPKKYLVLTVLIVSFISIAHVLMPESLNSRFVNTRTEIGEFDESTQGRFYYWESALEIFLKNPMGIGVGQMRGAMESRIGKNVDPHNSFLQTACEYGFVGLVVFVAMLVSVLKKAWEIWLDQSLPEIYRAYALGIGGFIGSFVVSNMFYANFYKDLVMGTVVIYLGMLAFIVAQVTALKERENQ